MTEVLSELPISAINALVELIIPHQIEEKTRIELGIKLIDTDLRFNGFGDFLTMTNRWYGHVSSKGRESNMKEKDSDLRISHIKQRPLELIVTLPISISSDAQSLIVLWLLLRFLVKMGLPSIETPMEDSADQAPAESAAVYQELYWGSRLGDIQKRMGVALSEDEKLSRLSPESRNELSRLLTTIYHRECTYLNASIQFSKESIQNITLKVQGTDNNKPERNNRVDLERPITATLIQDGKKHQTQIIEYSANGSGLSFLIPTIPEKEKKNIKNKSKDISLLIGEKKYSAVIVHIDGRGDGLFIGVQFRFPIQNLAKVLDR